MEIIETDWSERQRRERPQPLATNRTITVSLWVRREPEKLIQSQLPLRHKDCSLFFSLSIVYYYLKLCLVKRNKIRLTILNYIWFESSSPSHGILLVPNFPTIAYVHVCIRFAHCGICNLDPIMAVMADHRSSSSCIAIVVWRGYDHDDHNDIITMITMLFQDQIPGSGFVGFWTIFTHGLVQVRPKMFDCIFS